MAKAADIDTRAVMVLAHEARRMQDAAERVALVVKAMALRRGVSMPPREVGHEAIDLGE
jgi:hypothetical protein